MVMLKGIDISHWQTVTDWNALARDVNFIYLKATEGDSFFDPTALERFNQAKAVGLKVGFYHFARFNTVAAAVKQADFFISKVGNLAVDIPHVLDIEVDNGNLSASALTQACVDFLERVKSQTGKPVMVYSYPDFIQNELAAPLAKYPLWYADYQQTVLPKNVWMSYVAHQTTDSGHVAGINGGVDLDLMEDGELIVPPPPKTYAAIGTVKVNASYLNVRADHDINSKIVGCIKYGQEFKAYALRFGWYNVGSGWVSDNYVTFKPY